MSLRSRLMLGMLLLLASAVVITDIVTTSSLSSFLTGRLDAQVDTAQHAVTAEINRSYVRAQAQAGSRHLDPTSWLVQASAPLTSAAGSSQSPSPTGAGGSPAPRSADPITVDPAPPTSSGLLRLSNLTSSVSGEVYVAVIGSSGQVLFQRPTSNNSPAPVIRRQLPAVLSASAAEHPTGDPSSETFAAASAHPVVTYWVQAVAVPGGTLILASSETASQQTLRSVVHVELLVSIVVILAAALLVLLIVRIGLIPLADMTKTAGAIAAGDLSCRIRQEDTRNEVGRLGSALNGMLAQIESAFAERESSQDRLRRFVADASHELRTPLTSIRGYAELLAKGALADDNARDQGLERIIHEATRMGVLIDDLLLLARLDQGRPLARELVDLGRLADQAVQDAAVATKDHPIDVVYDDGAIVLGDPDRLRQIIDNLVRNALVHTPSGTAVYVSVSVEGGAVRLTVRDEGIGLSDSEADQVFDRFYRVSNSRTGEGTGLGLSIVANLAEAHGGNAELVTRPGIGSSFSVILPLASTRSKDPGVGVHPLAVPARVGR